GLVGRQGGAVLATQTLAEEDVPQRLQTAVEANRKAIGSRPARAGRLAPRIALAGAAGVAAVVVAATLLTGGPGAPTIADAARLAAQTPTEPAPPSAGTAGTRLALAVDGVVFPDLARLAGWAAVGVRHGKIDGRAATVVFYRKNGRRVAYAIVAGKGLARPSAGRTTLIRGEPFQTLRLNDRLVVTWRRGGHTCVLIGQATRGELVELASWP